MPLTHYLDKVITMFDRTPEEKIDIFSDELIDIEQGPSLKNRALQDVELVFYTIIGMPGFKTDYFLLKNNQENTIINFANGKKINISLALKYANLEYFKITDSSFDIELIKKCEEFLKIKYEPFSPAKNLCNERMPIYQVEEDAIYSYTNNSDRYNFLLRGKSPCFDYIEKTFVELMLIASGTNKNLLPDNTPKKLHGHKDNKLPLGMTAKMKNSRLARRPGFFSTSELTHENREGEYDAVLYSFIEGGGRKSISCCSKYDYEKEIIFPPGCTIFFKKLSNSDYKFDAKIISGVETEKLDNYLVEVALAEYADCFEKMAAESEKLDDRTIHYAITRQACATSYCDAVVKYLEKHTTNIDFKTFCKDYHIKYKQIIKIILAFSNPFFDDLSSRSIEKDLSSNFKNFYDIFLTFSDEEYQFYIDIISNIDQSNFYFENKDNSKKTFINFIITFIRWLEFTGYYDSSENLLTYISNLKDDNDNLMIFSEEQSHDLNLLIKNSILSSQITRGKSILDDDNEDYVRMNINKNIDNCNDRCDEIGIRTLGKMY